MRKKVLSSPRLEQLKQKRKQARRKKFYLYVFFIFFILIGLSFLSRIKSINIQDVSISGNEVIDTKDIQEVVSLNIEGDYLWIFPKTNFLFFPRQKIKLDLMESYPRLKEVSLKLEKRVLVISVVEREAHYTWCGETLPETEVRLDSIKCYFTDESGFVFDTAPYFSGNVYFRFYGPLDDFASAEDDPIGHHFVSNGFQDLIDFRDRISDMEIDVSSLLKKPDGEFEFYISNEKAPPNAPKIVFSIEKDLLKLAENLQASIITEPFSNELAEKRNDLSYIDLRFENKVYYKFR